MKQGLERRESLNLTRTYPVSPENVWRAWTDPEALRVWWSQSGYPGWKAELDVRVGGRYRIFMHGPDGRQHELRGVYRDVVPHSRLAFTWTVHASVPQLPRLDGESLVTVVLLPVAGGTELIFTQTPMFDVSARGGWIGALANLGDYLKGSKG